MSVGTLPIEREEAGPGAGIITIRLEQPGRPVVVLDHDLLRRLEATLASIPAGTPGVVLASASERVFVAGADLKTISEWNDDELDRYLAFGSRVFLMFTELRCPTVAAINGAALGGGLELAMHCDALIGAPSASGKPYPVGLPEAGLCLCPGWGGTNLLPARMNDAAEAIRRTATGQTMTFDEAVRFGLFDRTSAPADLIAACKQWIIETGAKPRRVGLTMWDDLPARRDAAIKALDLVRGELPQTDSAAAVAEALDAGLARGYSAALEVERRRLVQLRHTPQAREALAAFFARSAGPKK